MTDEVKTAACPTEEELSAWYDSQEQDQSLEEHVAGCPECKRIVGSYKTIDLGVRHTLDAATDKDLSERIKERSARRLKEDDQRRQRMGTWIRIVACVAALIGVLVVIGLLHAHSKSKAKRPGGGHVQPDGSNPGGGNGQLVDLAAANLLGYAHTEDSVKQLAGQAADDKKTHQIWSVKDTGLPVKVLKNLMAAKHGDAFEKLMAAEASSCSVLLDLDREHLQKLVDHLDKCGFKLVSDEGPRPGDAPPSGADAKAQVHYLVDFVQQ